MNKKLLRIAAAACLSGALCAGGFALSGCAWTTDMVSGEYHYANVWAPEAPHYGVKVNVEVQTDKKGDRIRKVTIADSDYVQLSAENEEAGWTDDNRQVYLDGEQELLNAYRGMYVADVLAMKASTSSTGEPSAVSDDSVVISGATQSSGRILLAVQDALCKFGGYSVSEGEYSYLNPWGPSSRYGVKVRVVTKGDVISKVVLLDTDYTVVSDGWADKDIWNNGIEGLLKAYEGKNKADILKVTVGMDANGQPIHYSPHNGKVLPGYLYTGTGFWDTFRCLFPLLNLVYPSVNEKMQAGFVNVYKESGFLPEWSSPGHRGCMVGNNSASVVADAYLKGLRGFDAETLWEAVKHGANAVHPQVSSTGRLGFEYYNKLGYVPYDVKINENVARTLEYAYDDWCIYKFGKALGKSDKELKPFLKHAFNYKNVFDKETNLMRGRNKDGKFQTPFSPLKWGDAFTEGNSWHYTWSVFHDPQGLIDLMGGKATFNAMLDSVFNVPPLFDDSYYGGVIHEIREMQIMNMGNYAHGNQPIQHMIYLYGYSGEPWKTQYWIREVMDKLYNANPDGYCGDEDNGQTSAWYVFSAMGFYPVCPGSNEYVLGTPYFDKVTLHLENGKTMTITAEDNSADNRYIQAMKLNGMGYGKNYLTHEDLLNVGSIVYTMGSTPNKARGTADSDAPYSFSKELAKSKKKK